MTVTGGAAQDCEEPMIKMSVMYPNSPGSKFDVDYYIKTHMPLVVKLVGPDLKGWGVDKGVDANGPYSCTGWLLFESLDAIKKSFEPVAPQLRADVPNYTDTKPTVQVAEVMAGT